MQVSNNSNTLPFPSYWPQPNGAATIPRSSFAPTSSPDRSPATTNTQTAASPKARLSTGAGTKSGNTVTDELLLRRIAQHDLVAFEQIYDQYAPLLYALILRMVQERSLADELLQETFMHIWAKAQEFSGEGLAAAWLFNVARNKSLDALQWLKRDPAQQAAHLDSIANEARNEITTSNNHTQLDRPGHHNGFEPENGASQHKLSGIGTVRVQQAMQVIQPEQRVCLELAFFGGLTQQAIAEHLHLPTSVVKNFIRKGLAVLEQTLYINELTTEQQRNVILA